MLQRGRFYHLCRMGTLLALTAGMVTLGGCREPLFPERAPRTQYERYDALRGEAAPRYEQSPGQGRAPGSRRPALRERLRPDGGYSY